MSKLPKDSEFWIKTDTFSRDPTLVVIGEGVGGHEVAPDGTTQTSPTGVEVTMTGTVVV
jgi:hypothetical protein